MMWFSKYEKSALSYSHKHVGTYIVTVKIFVVLKKKSDCSNKIEIWKIG